RVAHRLRLGRAVERHQLDAEEIPNVWEPIFCRGHRFYDVAGVAGMIVAVEADDLLAARRMLMRREETDFALAFDLDDLRRAIRADRDGVALEELVVLIELDRAGMLFFVDDVRARAGGDHHAARGELDHLT